MVPSFVAPLLQYVSSAVRALLQWIVVSVCVILMFHRGCSALRRWQRRQQQQRRSPKSPTNHHNHTKEVVVAFFHPYCTGGGGGERVLWKMIQVLGDQLMIPTTTTTTIPSSAVTKRHDNDSKQQQPVLSFHPTIIIYTIDAPTATYVQGMYAGSLVRSSVSLSRNTSSCSLIAMFMLLSFQHMHSLKK